MKYLVMIAVLIGGVLFLGENWMNRKWDMETRFTVIDLNNPVKITSFDPATNMGLVLVVPDNLQVDTVNGRGSLRAGVLNKAADMFGVKWAADSLADYMGITYTGIQDKLGLWDRINWWWWQRKVNWSEIDLGDTVYVKKITAPDGLVLLRLEDHWPLKAAEWYSSANLARETENISVINSTSEGGLGAHVAKTIENSGLRVIAVTNSQSELGKCQLSGSLVAKESLAGKWLLKQFACNWINTTGSEEGITLTMGKEYQNWWVGD